MQKYQVTGMSCAACQARVEKAVGKVPGVESVAVSLLTNSMGVTGSASPEEIVRAVKEAGYGAAYLAPGSSSSSGVAGSTGHGAAGSGSASSLISDSEDPLKDTETPKLLRRLGLSVGFLLILMYVSMGHNMLGLPLPGFFHENFLGLAILQMCLALIVMAINRKFFKNGFSSLLHGAPNMDTLVALGSGVSFLWSMAVLFQMTGKITAGDMNMSLHALYHDQLYFESAAMIPALITVGKTLESFSKGRTTNALKSLMKLAPKTARLTSEDGSDERIVPVEEVKVGDIFSVKPGEAIPVDGEVILGESAVDESALTGESIPVDKAPKSRVSAATMNQSGYITCRATRVGEDTTLSQIIQMVSDASATKAPIARIADRVSGVFVPAVMAISVIVIIGWLIYGASVSFSLARGIAVLVISCPCALGLATPVAIMVGNGLGAKNGVLVKTGAALESTGKMNIVALDKTGTITKGNPAVTVLLPQKQGGEEELLEKAYLLEMRSEHPLSRAIVNERTRRHGEDGKEGCEDACPVVSDFAVHAGHGLQGRINGHLMHGGNGEYIRKFASVSETMKKEEARCAASGQTPLFFEEDGQLLGMISVADTIKEDSAEGIRQLKNLGLTTVMLTGDNEKTARAIAESAGVDRVVAGVLPEEKAAVVKRLQESGKVLMVGDGINDAPALTSADIGMAIGAGTDVAIDSADIVLMNGSLLDVAAAIRLSRKTLRNIHENLFWAFFYNAICIPVAAGLLSWKMHPMIGAAAMSISSFTVCMNALRLNLFNMKNAAHDKPLPGSGHMALPEEIGVRESENRSTNMKKTLKIEGMMCGHCEASVKKALEELPWIETAIPNHNTNSCVIEISDGSSWDEEKVREIIEGKDYKYLGEE